MSFEEKERSKDRNSLSRIPDIMSVWEKKIEDIVKKMRDI